ncbi:MAG: DNA-processing protein DprA [Clostridia bacterium]|nr:DNA-processing protein DprA [Clostridia bacterium]
MTRQQELATYIWLSRMTTITGIGVPRIRRMAEKAGSAAALADSPPERLAEWLGGPAEETAKILRYARDGRHREEAGKTAEYAAGRGIGCLADCDPGYPPRLLEIRSHPWLLFFRGDIERILCRPECVATVVGSRSPTGYGRTATRKIVGEIARAGVTIVSGLARGIDSIAHRAALDAGGMTAAVLGGGIDHVYPPEHKALLEEIAEKGVVVSEHGPGIRACRPYFAARNRILSGLADCVAVTEASEVSGSMITAGFAADQGRDLFALPGSVFEPQSKGCNQLIQEGASVLTCAEDLLYRLPLGRMPRTAECEVREMEQGLRMSGVIECLRGRSLTPDELSEASGIPLAGLMPVLSALELVGDVENRRGRFSLTPAG